jgi:branched-chain amino acid aminotransferase
MACQVRQVATQLPPVDRFAVLAPVALCVEQRALVVCQLLAMDGGHTLPRQAQTTQLLAHAVQPPGRVIEVDHQNCKMLHGVALCRRICLAVNWAALSLDSTTVKSPIPFLRHSMTALPPSMSDRDGKIWMDGQMVDWRDAKIHVLTHTLHYGCGAFEGVRAYPTDKGTAIFRLQEHTERLFNSAKILRMKLPFTHDEVNEAQKAVVRENKLASCYLRPLTWIGDKKLGVSPKGNTIHLMVAAWAWGAYLGEEGMKRGIRVKTSSYTRHHVNITMTQAKAVSNYTNSILANMEVTDEGYDEALLLDSSGFVSEGAGENIFIVKNGIIYTPDLSAGALNGITRNTVFHIAKDLGLEVVQKRITRDEVYIADEAFFTGTAAEVTPIRELDRIELGKDGYVGSRGPVTEKIQSAFFDIVHGRNPRYAHWLSLV